MADSYAVIQEDLNAPCPERAVVERAILGVPNLVKADAHNIIRDLYGFVLEHVPKPTATAFASNLTAAGFRCRAIPQNRIPKLMPSMGFQRMDWEPSVLAHAPARAPVLSFRTSTGQTFLIPVDQVALASTGWIRIEARTRVKPSSKAQPNLFGATLESEIFSSDETKKETTPAQTILRIEFFSFKAPNRLVAAAERLTPVFVNSVAVTSRHREEAAKMFASLCAANPQMPINRGMERLWDPSFIYPAPRAFEEELRWHLAQIAAKRT